MNRRLLRLPLLALALAACADADGAPEAAPAPPPAAAPAADAVPASEADRRDVSDAMRAFQATLERPAALANGHPSREALVRAFVDAVERGDTAAVIGMSMTRAEFAWLYYPHTGFVRGRRAMEPELLWYLLLRNGEKGINRVMTRYAGRDLGYEGHRCTPAARTEGPNRIHDGCVLRLAGVETQGGEIRLFGSIVEREGTFKFVSYANDL